MLPKRAFVLESCASSEYSLKINDTDDLMDMLRKVQTISFATYLDN